MVSGLMCDCHGSLNLGGDRKSYKIIAPGKNADGYWTNEDLVKLLELVIPLFEETHPDCDLYFIFDNSQNHHARRPDGLSVNALNLADGGKITPKLHNTVYGEGNIRQEMQHPNGIQKEIRIILSERGLWKDGLLLDCKGDCGVDCCARKFLSSQSDFANEKNWLQTVVETRRHFQNFLPKFHCELNFIEMVLGIYNCSTQMKL